MAAIMPSALNVGVSACGRYLRFSTDDAHSAVYDTEDQKWMRNKKHSRVVARAARSWLVYMLPRLVAAADKMDAQLPADSVTDDATFPERKLTTVAEARDYYASQRNKHTHGGNDD